jgi:rhomboid protease GluP
VDTTEPVLSPSSRTASPWVTYFLIIANLGVFVLELAAGADPIKPTAQKMVELGGDFAPLTLHGEPWRLVSSMFLHFGLLHIALNMVCLYQGRVVEALFGKYAFGAIYLVAGLAGGVASMARSTLVVSAGASGAVFGVYGAFGAYLVFRKAAVADEIWQRATRRIATFVAINLMYGFSTPGIDMSAHIGGLAAGFVLGAALLVGQRADVQRTARAIVIAVGGVALAATSTFVMAGPEDVTPVLKDFESVEHVCITTWNELLEQNKTGTLQDPAMADRIEREVIAPWKSMRARFVAVDHPPARLQPLWDVTGLYLGSRQAAWEAFVVVLRAPPEQREAALAEYQRNEAQVTTDAEAVKVEVARLSAK